MVMLQQARQLLVSLPCTHLCGHAAGTLVCHVSMTDRVLRSRLQVRCCSPLSGKWLIYLHSCASACRGCNRFGHSLGSMAVATTTGAGEDDCALRRACDCRLSAPMPRPLWHQFWQCLKRWLQRWWLCKQSRVPGCTWERCLLSSRHPKSASSAACESRAWGQWYRRCPAVIVCLAVTACWDAYHAHARRTMMLVQ